ncbi:MAG TPA: hypothetical protein VMV69_07585 [Pirellulales bacterium]|nr:hypothetical protein [Pirellulales bacterium]
MSMSTADLWPEDIAGQPVRTPVQILREQAVLLGQKTKNVVEGRVEQSGRSPYDDKFHHAFYIKAPILRYQYRLFTIDHDINLYPLRLIRDNDEPPIEAANADEFQEALRAVFSSEDTRRVVQNLVAQSLDH